MPMNPYTEKLLKRVRDLPLPEIRDLIAHLKYVVEWVYTNEGNCRVLSHEATRAEARCAGREFSAVAQLWKQAQVWEVSCEGKVVGTAPDLHTATELAETELELRGYVLPWRRDV